MEVDRRSIEELGTLYTLEPELRDIFVEGSDDGVLLKWYFRGRTQKPVSVQEIDSVNVPAELVIRHAFDVGNRGRVLTLATELTSILDDDAKFCCTVVYDGDFDTIQGIQELPPNAIRTDFSCIEMYLFNVDTIEKFASLVMMNPELDASLAISSLATVLVRLWVIKAANHLLGFGMTWISFDSLCSLEGTSIKFDEGQFIHRYLMNNGRLSDKAQFLEKVDEIGKNVSEDPRDNMDGHHFFALARWYFLQFARENSALKDRRGFERAITACVETGFLEKFPLFDKLLERVGT